MNVLIISSASIDVPKKYLSIAKEVSSYLAYNNFDLIYGASSLSMMGQCYNEFVKYGRKVYAFTTSCYKDDLENLKKAKGVVLDSTFDLKKTMFNNSNLILVLPGGIGTLSELLSYIEEKRSNNKDIPIIIYNEDGFYDSVLAIIDKMIEEKFTSNVIYNSFNIVSDMGELKKLIENKFIKESVENEWIDNGKDN